jgi:hypothetical protein
MELFERAKQEKRVSLALLSATLNLAATRADIDVATSVRCPYAFCLGAHPNRTRVTFVVWGTRTDTTTAMCGTRQALALMKEHGWEPNERTYTTLLRLYSQV